MNNILENARARHNRTAPAPTAQPNAKPVGKTTLADASYRYLESVESGTANLVTTSVADLDYALGGGVEFGEMVIFAARPSHGKSAVALQCLHEWTANKLPCCMVSEEMSSLMLGKRTVQFLSAMPQEHWRGHIDHLRRDVDNYKRTHADCFILENCRTAEAAANLIEKHAQQDGVKCAVVDYAQLLSSPGKGRYEQITNTSITLRQLASRSKVLLLVLCQLNRAIEQRPSFVPSLSDLRDSGQLEQDADVITFLVWPHRIDKTEPQNKYQFYIAKNRNRMINEQCVTCHFAPSRQMFRDAMPQEFETEIPA